MEYVIVTFLTDRLVYIDDEEGGYTNERLKVDAGTHVFALGNLQNFHPSQRTVMVRNTTPLAPLEIPFYRNVD